MTWPVNNDDILRSIHELFDSGKWWIYKGETVKAFEQRFAEFIGCKYGVSLCNGTVALEIVLKGLGIGAGDKVVLPAYDFYSLPKSVANTGATPVFVDVLTNNPTINANAAREAIKDGAKAVVAVHISGSVAEMDKLRQICDETGAYLIEDCAQASGASYGGRRAGSWGHAGVFSFGGVKLMTCGQGGMITTSDHELYEKCYAIANRGHLINGLPNPYGIIGDNYQLSELSAAILNPQLDILEEMCARRESIMNHLDEAISHIDGLSSLKQFDKTTYRAQMRYCFFYNSDRMPRSEFIMKAREAGIPLSGGYESVKNAPQLFNAYSSEPDYPAAQHAEDSIISVHHIDILRGEEYWDEALECMADILK